MLDFVQPSTDKCQFFRPSFAFGIFRLSRINKKCSILFDPVQICINFLDQVLLLVYSDFLDSTKKSSIMFNPVQICFNFLDQVLLLVYFDFLDSTKECSIFFDSVQICFAFSTKYWYIPVSRLNKKYLILFHPVQICFDFLDQNLIYFDFLDPIIKVFDCV